MKHFAPGGLCGPKEERPPPIDYKEAVLSQMRAFQQETLETLGALTPAVNAETDLQKRMRGKFLIQEGMKNLGGLALAIAVLETVPLSRFTAAMVGLAKPTPLGESLEPDEGRKH